MKLDAELQRQMSEIVGDEGLEHLATEVVGSGPSTIIRVVVDGPDGVTLDQCAEVSRQVSALLDVEDPIRHRYSLEVSSPGLDRKLFSPGDYERFAGRRVKVRMRPSYRAHKVLTGELVGLNGATLRVRADSSEVIDVPFDEVFETRLEVDWSSILKEGKSRP